MPIYEYQCSACGHRLESIQKMSDQPLVACPVCHQSALQKLVSASRFQLKGTGWYATDFRDKGKKEAKSDKKEESGKGEKEGKKDDKSDSKDTAAK